jgi:hypothetical protein
MTTLYRRNADEMQMNLPQRKAPSTITSGSSVARRARPSLYAAKGGARLDIQDIEAAIGGGRE